jgi:hypothetical protein
MLLLDAFLGARDFHGRSLDASKYSREENIQGESSIYRVARQKSNTFASNKTFFVIARFLKI